MTQSTRHCQATRQWMNDWTSSAVVSLRLIKGHSWHSASFISCKRQRRLTTAWRAQSRVAWLGNNDWDGVVLNDAVKLTIAASLSLYNIQCTLCTHQIFIHDRIIQQSSTRNKSRQTRSQTDYRKLSLHSSTDFIFFVTKFQQKKVYTLNNAHRTGQTTAHVQNTVKLLVTSHDVFAECRMDAHVTPSHLQFVNPAGDLSDMLVKRAQGQ